MVSCAICLDPVPPSDDQTLAYHPHCLRELFGTPRLPSLDLDTGDVQAAAVRMAGKMSISGYQQKVSMTLSPGAKKLVASASGGRFILKPQIATPHIPENEHLSMRLAQLAGLDVPPCGLVQLRDGALAYIIRRFDRSEEGGKCHVEDFCQLAALAPAEKYHQSAELCMRLLRQYASEPTVAVFQLYRSLLFSYGIGNGDLHLKNLALLYRSDGTRVLAPVYDLVNTELAIGDKKFALSVAGANGPIRYSRWKELAAEARIPPKAGLGVLMAQIKVLKPMIQRIQASFLPREAQEHFECIVVRRLGWMAPKTGEDSSG